MSMPMWPQHLLAIHQFSPQQIKKLLTTATHFKQTPQKWEGVLAGKQFALLFEKNSLRTRVSFTSGLSRLGATVQYLDYQHEKLGKRETLQDVTKNLSCFLDGMIVRSNSHHTLKTIQHHSDIPVVNALCDHHHPCQALADVMTLQEKVLQKKVLQEKTGEFASLHLAYLGEGNNVCHSLMEIMALLGGRLSVVTPPQGRPDETIIKWCQTTAKHFGGQINILHDVSELKQADILYTDTWISMGDNKPIEETVAIYQPFQVNEALMQRVGAQWFMHCQPIHRGMEVTAEVADSAASLIYCQAENRMYVQNAFFLEYFLADVNSKKTAGAQ